MEVVVSAMFGFRRLFKGSIGVACSLARSMSSWSVENYEWQCLLDPLLAVRAAPLAYVIRRGRVSYTIS